nr:hypothetical protein [Tanacetum cinerariifolium]
MMDTHFEMELELILLLSVNAARHILTIASWKLMLLSLTYYCQLKVNDSRHNLLLLDGKEIIITESFVSRDLRLADEEGIDCLPNSTIFENLKLMGDLRLADEEGIDCLPNSNIFENLELMGKPKGKNTQVPQPGGSTKHVADEAVYKELDDELVRAATTASSLEVEQDIGNIDKTQSQATPNESSSQGTSSDGGR